MGEDHRATGLWCQAGVPHRGWECIFIEDLGEPSRICDMCQVAEIRYAHHVQHEEYDQTLMVGCVCAENLCEGYDGKAAEEDAKKRWRWMLKELVWRKSKKGTSVWCRTRDDFLAIAYWYETRHGGTEFGCFVKDLHTSDERKTSDTGYPTVDLAKKRAMQLIERLRSQRTVMSLVETE